MVDIRDFYADIESLISGKNGTLLGSLLNTLISMAALTPIVGDLAKTLRKCGAAQSHTTQIIKHGDADLINKFENSDNGILNSSKKKDISPNQPISNTENVLNKTHIRNSIVSPQTQGKLMSESISLYIQTRRDRLQSLFSLPCGINLLMDDFFDIQLQR